MKKLVLILVILIIIGTKSNGEEVNNITKDNDIIIGYDYYPSSYALTYLTKYILKDNGYNVKLKQIKRKDMIKSINNKIIDVTLTCYLPDLDYNNLMKYNESVEDIAVNYNGVQLGFFVPKYSIIADVNELNFYKKQLDKTIFTIKNNSLLKERTKQWLEDKNLDFDIVEIDSKDLEKKIKNCYKTKEWFLFAGWTPHCFINRYSLRMLYDEQNNNYPQEMHTIIRKDYQIEPVIKILKNLYLESWEMNQLIDCMVNNPSDYDKGIKLWMEMNKGFKLKMESLYN